MAFQENAFNLGENEDFFGFEGMTGFGSGVVPQSNDYYAPSSFPSQPPLPQEFNNFPHSFAGNPSPLHFHNAQFSMPQSASYQIPSTTLQQPFNTQFLANAYFGDSERLALQMGLAGQGQSSISSREADFSNQSGNSVSKRTASGLSATRPTIQTQSHPGSSYGQEVREGNDIFTRPLLPGPRRTQSSKSTASGAPPSTSITPANSLRYSETPRPIQSSQPTSPRGPTPFDYTFNSLETDLDQFRRNQEEDFALAAAAAVSSISTKSNRTTANNSPAGSFDVASPRVSSDPTFAALPTRSSGPSNATSPRDGLSTRPPSIASPSAFKPPSPEDFLTKSPSPSTFDHSSFIEDDDCQTGRDPIAAQAWRMVNKAKNNLPGGARLENLTWRLMSMTLKKRRAETAAAELQAATLLAATALTVPVTVKEEELKPKQVIVQAEVSDRGRRGRTPNSNNASAATSPEVEEHGEMDWRAKSQSRSRSRAPAASMDWRAQSRSRSRAPIFRAPVPLAPLASFDTASAQYMSSRFYGDRGGVSITPAEELANFDLAASLGLSPSGSSFSPYGQFPAIENSGVSAANYNGLEDTLNLLISQQALVGDSKPASAWTMAPSQSAQKAVKKSSFTSSGIPSYVEEEEPDYSFLAKSTQPINLENAHLQKLLDTNSAAASLSTSPHSPQVGSPHSFSNRLAFANGSATNLIRSNPAPTEVPPHLMSHLESLAVSTSSANFINPPSTYFNSGLPSDSNNLYDYLNSIPDQYIAPYSNYQPIVPTHIDPSHLSNINFSQFPIGENSWSYSPNGPATSARFTQPAPTTKNRRSIVPNGKISGLEKKASNVARPSSDDLLVSEEQIGSQPVSRNHSRANTANSGSGSVTSVTKPIVITTAHATEEVEVRCLNCNTTNTPLWRRDTEGKPLCNACGLFRNLHGVDRPAALNTGVIKKRNRARGTKTDGVKVKAERGGARNARRNSISSAPSAPPARAEPYPTQRPALHPELSLPVES